MGGVSLMICTTCRRVAGEPEVSGSDACPGARLYAALSALPCPEGVTLRPVECLSACSRGCAVALAGGPGRWSYVYAEMDPAADAPDILDGAARYAATEDGLVPWRERPEIFRKRSVARLPPQIA